MTNKKCKIIKRTKAERDKLILDNYNLVYKISKKFKNYHVDFDDLIQEGLIGLIKAVDRFDATKGFKFSTYASYWIFDAMNKFWHYDQQLIRVPFEELRRQKAKGKQSIHEPIELTKELTEQILINNISPEKEVLSKDEYNQTIQELKTRKRELQRDIVKINNLLEECL